MKTLSLTIINQKNISALIAILLGVLVLMSANVNASDTLKAKPFVREQNWFDLKMKAELLEISQQLQAEASHALHLEKTFVIVDQQNELVYEGTVENMLIITNAKLSSLLRKSSLLIDYQGIAYYMIER